MTHLEIKHSVNDLNKLVLEGKIMEAFEKYYDDAVVMQENDMPAIVSKEANRQRELEFLRNITAFRGAEVKDVAIAENIAAVIWHFDYTHKNWGERNFTQVAVQEWKNGKIIKEKFIYNN